MSDYILKLTKQDNRVFARVVRRDKDGYEQIANDWIPRFFATEKSAIKAFKKYKIY